jgi:hypothetical protein
MILLPVNPIEKISVVYKLFHQAKQELKTDTAAVKSVLEQLGEQISERSIWNYKKRWDVDSSIIKHDVEIKDVDVYPTIKKIDEKKDRARKSRAVVHQIKKALATQFFPEQMGVVEWLDPNKEYKPEEIKQYIYDVCSELTIGSKGLMNILDSKGITLYLWNKWLDTDEEYMVVFERAKSQQSLSYVNRIQEAMRKIAMSFLTMEDIKEESIQYEFVEKQDPTDPTKFIYVEVPRYRVIKTRPQKPDTQTMKTVIDMIRETTRSLGSADSEDINKIMAMSEIELRQAIADLEKERSKRTDAD